MVKDTLLRLRRGVPVGKAMQGGHYRLGVSAK